MSNSIRGGDSTSNDTVTDNRLPSLKGKKVKLLIITSTDKREK